MSVLKKETLGGGNKRIQGVTNQIMGLFGGLGLTALHFGTKK